MGWHKFLMKHGMGSPGYIARRMAKRYMFLGAMGFSEDEQEILHRVFVERIAAQTTMGGSGQYHWLREGAVSIDEMLAAHPDLFSLTFMCCVIEHPELLGAAAPKGAFDVLAQTLNEVLDEKAPHWRVRGVWNNPKIVCQLCKSQVVTPDPSKMSVALDSEGKPEFSCEVCAAPLAVRAASVMDFFVDIGSPGYIARRMATSYMFLKAVGFSEDEQEILHRVFVERIADQTTTGKPSQYHFLREHASSIDEILAVHPDLFSLVFMCIVIEHPELLSTAAPEDTFDVLAQTLNEVLDDKAPGWRARGVWSNPKIVCQLCKSQLVTPDPSKMSVALDSEGKPEFSCAVCAPPLVVRAISVLGFFAGKADTRNTVEAKH